MSADDFVPLVADAFRVNFQSGGSRIVNTMAEAQHIVRTAEGAHSITPMRRVSENKSDSSDAKDAARYRWWRKWWLDAKDDCETVNSLDYDIDEPETYDAAIDAEIAREQSKPGPSHVCGLAGYDGMRDGPCPGCEHSREDSSETKR